MISPWQCISFHTARPHKGWTIDGRKGQGWLTICASRNGGPILTAKARQERLSNNYIKPSWCTHPLVYGLYEFHDSHHGPYSPYDKLKPGLSRTLGDVGSLVLRSVREVDKGQMIWITSVFILSQEKTGFHDWRTSGFDSPETSMIGNNINFTILQPASEVNALSSMRQRSKMVTLAHLINIPSRYRDTFLQEVTLDSPSFKNER